MPKLTKAKAAAMGRKGGKALVAKKGKKYMAMIGRRGLKAACGR